MLPFSKPRDERFATEVSYAIAASLEDEPERWKLLRDDFLQHDSGIVIDTLGFVVRPCIDDEPEMNGVIVSRAIDHWVSEMVQRPVVVAKLEIVNTAQVEEKTQ